METGRTIGFRRYEHYSAWAYLAWLNYKLKYWLYSSPAVIGGLSQYKRYLTSPDSLIYSGRGLLAFSITFGDQSSPEPRWYVVESSIECLHLDHIQPENPPFFHNFPTSDVIREAIKTTFLATGITK